MSLTASETMGLKFSKASEIKNNMERYSGFFQAGLAQSPGTSLTLDLRTYLNLYILTIHKLF